jgi:uroporphyrin-III C-methyltransferase / precorrin-2 dehydrogenase / sirohydrochlorin ferrochelatase
MSALERGVAPAQAPRIGALARLPIFLALAGKRALVAGNGAPVAWKAELLSAAGAEVKVFADHPCEELRAVALQAARGSITLHDHTWQPADLRGAAVAVGGFDDETQAQRFATAARDAGVPVNVIDRPAYCDFAFGAIVNRSPLVIGISTDGAAPVFAQAIRARLESMLPHGFARWAHAAQHWRQRVKSARPTFTTRHRFWRAFSQLALAQPEREPASSDFDALMSASTHDAVAGIGAITIIPAGSGHADLLTLRAVRLLQASDVILLDDGVAPDIVDLARREAKNVLLAKSTGASARATEDVDVLAIAHAKAGKRVAWLRIGAPGNRYCADETIAACRAAGIAVDLVPGVSEEAEIARQAMAPLLRDFQFS